MRKPERLLPIYTQMAKIHADYVADLRLGQLFINFLTWHCNQYGNDFFYVEDEELLKRFNKYLKGDLT